MIYSDKSSNDKKKKKKTLYDGILENFEFLDKPIEKGKFTWSKNCQMFNSINNNVQMTNLEEEQELNPRNTSNLNENGKNIIGNLNGNINLTDQFNGTGASSIQNFTNTPKFSFTNNANSLFNNEINHNRVILNDDTLNYNNIKPNTPINTSGSILTESTIPVKPVMTIERTLSARNDTINRQNFPSIETNSDDKDKILTFNVLQSKSSRSILKNGSVSLYVLIFN